MAAANTDKFRKGARRWVGQIGAGGVADDAVTTVPLASSTNLPTDTAVAVVINRVDSSGTATPTLEETVVGVVSGNNLVSCLRGVEGTAQAHSAGAVVELLFVADNWNDLIDGVLVQHNQLGLHTNITACNVAASGTATILTAAIQGTATASQVITSGVSAKGIVTASNITASEITSQVASTPLKFNDAHYVPEATYTPDAAGTATLDVSQASIHKITMPAGNITIAISNETNGQCFIIEITQDGTGSRTVTWFSTIKWAGGSAPTLTTTANKRDTFGFRVTGTDTYDGFVVGQNI
jgi:hypothetical protein